LRSSLRDPPLAGRGNLAFTLGPMLLTPYPLRLTFFIHCSLLIARCSSLIAHRSLLITHCSLLIAHRSSLIACFCLRALRARRPVPSTVEGSPLLVAIFPLLPPGRRLCSMPSALLKPGEVWATLHSFLIAHCLSRVYRGTRCSLLVPTYCLRALRARRPVRRSLGEGGSPLLPPGRRLCSMPSALLKPGEVWATLHSFLIAHCSSLIACFCLLAPSSLISPSDTKTFF
jgi:hypothetical protein